MKTIIENYHNGNLFDAKLAAQTKSKPALIKYMTDELSYAPELAAAIANFLKGSGTFQAACDAETLVNIQRRGRHAHQ